MAATPTLHDFRDEFPEFDARVSDEVVQALLSDAVVLHSATEYGVYLAAAHILSLDKDSTLGGEITSVRVGEVAQTSTSLSKDERSAFLSTTHYGRRLLARERSSETAVVFAV